VQPPYDCQPQGHSSLRGESREYAVLRQITTRYQVVPA
jgi:hypothetical protein